MIKVVYVTKIFIVYFKCNTALMSTVIHTHTRDTCNFTNVIFHTLPPKLNNTTYLQKI